MLHKKGQKKIWFGQKKFGKGVKSQKKWRFAEVR